MARRVVKGKKRRRRRRRRRQRRRLALALALAAKSARATLLVAVEKRRLPEQHGSPAGARCLSAPDPQVQWRAWPGRRLGAAAPGDEPTSRLAAARHGPRGAAGAAAPPAVGPAGAAAGAAGAAATAAGPGRRGPTAPRPEAPGREVEHRRGAGTRRHPRRGQSERQPGGVRKSAQRVPEQVAAQARRRAPEESVGAAPQQHRSRRRRNGTGEPELPAGRRRRPLRPGVGAAAAVAAAPRARRRPRAGAGAARVRRGAGRPRRRPGAGPPGPPRPRARPAALAAAGAARRGAAPPAAAAITRPARGGRGGRRLDGPRPARVRGGAQPAPGVRARARGPGAAQRAPRQRRGRAVVGAPRPAQRVQGRGRARRQEVLPPRDERQLQGARGLRVHRATKELRRGLLQGALPAALQPGAPPRAAAEPHLEGRPQQGAAALLRAQQARRARDPLLRRERADQAQGLQLEGHARARVRLLLSGRLPSPRQRGPRPAAPLAPDSLRLVEARRTCSPSQRLAHTRPVLDQCIWLYCTFGDERNEEKSTSIGSSRLY